MSYVRFAWDGSDVYVYESCNGGIECCGCRFGSSFNAGTEEEMISHLAKHRRAGHFVPEYAITGLWNAIPGATKAKKPQPLLMEKNSLMFSLIGLQLRYDDLRCMLEQEEAEENGWA